jgi:predicted lipid-binding transport protein (Tim44 family)
MVSLLVGGTLLGVLGALLALPIAAGIQMVVRQLRVELPGEEGLEEIRAQDEKAEQVYEALTQGAPAADAAVIASELAQKLKKTEAAGSILTTAEMPVMIREIEDAAAATAAAASARLPRAKTDGGDKR